MSESAEAESSAEPDDAPSVPRARRRGRTTLLIATAAVLGLVAGTCAGYLIQADRVPTKLPSLSQPVVAQAKGDGPEPLSAAQDHRVKTNGDLRKLLLPRPKGTKVPDWAPEQDGWLDMAAYAHSLEDSDVAFGRLAKAEFRRAAGVSWTVGSNGNTQIRLVQYRQEENLSAADRASDWYVYGSSGEWPLPGASDGMVYLFKPEREAGYLPLYKAQATASRGDIAMEIWIYDSKPIPKSKIMDLAKRQLERL
ncbi:hypothetical protein ACFYW8_11320 [Streptomyces sp. NPDC002742]|uniref:hypothetical protein n=1 Tax=Streptomyces sp. NPDC002742 TaxID=3364663 RepID=UPI003697D167